MFVLVAGLPYTQRMHLCLHAVPGQAGGRDVVDPAVAARIDATLAAVKIENAVFD